MIFKMFLAVCIVLIALNTNSEQMAIPGSALGQCELGAGLKEIAKIIGVTKCNQFRAKGLLFKDVFHVLVQKDVAFDLMLSCSSSGVTFFFYNKKLVCIFVKGDDVRLKGGVTLRKGVSALRFAFGNSGFQLINKYGSAMLLYKRYGLAFIDDKRDDVVDGLLIFQPR